MPPPRDTSPLNSRRAALREARARAADRARELEAANREVIALTARLGAGHPDVREAEAARARAERALAEARGAARAAGSELRDRADALLSADPAAPIGPLDASYPLLLLPVRLETHFARDQASPELWVRVYPDEIVAHLHDQALTREEIDEGRAFWNEAWASEQAATAWRRLVSQMSATRAAWVVRATTPTNLAARPAGTPAFPSLVPRAPGVSIPAETHLLPDRWIVLGYRAGREVLRGIGRPIVEPLALTLAPPPPADLPPDPTIDVSGDGLAIDADSAWTIDFDQAVAAGMGLRLPLSQEDLAQGFERLFVLGVKSTLEPDAAGDALAALLDNHHYTRGWAFVAQGTPTNNTSGQPSAFPPEDAGGAVSFAVEHGESLATPEGDGVRFARVLGLSPDVVAHVGGADRREQVLAAAMNDALWPVTGGYFLEQMMAPVVDEAAIAETRRHFVQHVRGRGPYPAFRIGGTPYGLLPVTALRRWRPDRSASGLDRELPRLLQTLRPLWAAAVPGVPRVDRSDDPDADLLATLGMDASAREVRVRQVTGGDFERNLRDLFGFDSAPLDDLQRLVARTLLNALGHPEWTPRILSMTFADAAPRFRMPLVASAPLSETNGLAVDYVAAIRSAGFGLLWRSRGRAEADGPNALLYHMLRHSALLEYLRIMFDILLRFGQAQPDDRREAELVHVVAGTEARLTVLEQSARPIPGVTGSVSLADALLTAGETRITPLAPDYARLDAYRSSLQALEGVPTAELERLFTETLDVCSHRFDAWVTSLASKRLEAMRERQPRGLHLGAYGWVENLQPASPGRHRRVTTPAGRTFQVQATSGGHIHAPSMSHAATAAILRSAYLSRSGADRVRYAVDLSSRRVRRARWLLDGVRNGQPLGALLGYQLERGLHEGHPGSDLDRYIEPLRHRFPLVTDKGGPSGEPAEYVGARNVVDGLALRKAWVAGTLTLGAGGLEVAPGDVPAVEAELRALDDTVDAVADLLLVEAVHQVVLGSMPAAAAALDGLAHGGVRPPDPAVAQLPRGGSTLTHRVAVVLGAPPLPDGPWATIPKTPRAAVEPCLDGWVGHLLGDPATVRCRVSYPDPSSADPARRSSVVVTLADLRLRPLDVLALAAVAEPEAETGELDRRIAFAAMATAPRETDLRITYERDPAWDRSAVRTFPELLELARAAGALIGGARPLRADDLQPPEAAAPPAAATVEASARAAQAKAALGAAKAALDAALAEVREGSPHLGFLRAALTDASLFGVAAAVPLSRRSTDDEAGATLVGQAESVAAELGRRASRVAAASDPVEIVHEAFGRDFIFLPRFVPPQSAELGQALTAGPSLGAGTQDIRQWLQQVQKVRPTLARWRRLWLYAQALGHTAPGYDLAQLPHVPGERWVGLPFGAAAERPPSGRLSLVLHRPATPAATEEWAGLLLDEWPELIPAPAETTGLAFHYDDPGAEAPQAILLAVPPDAAPEWTFDTLVEILQDTLELAKMRGVDGELLGILGQLLPAIYLSTNVKDETISTSFTDALIADPRVAPTPG